MLVVDASCLYEVVTSTARAEAVRERLAADDEQLAPHVIDVEVFGIIRRHHLVSSMPRRPPKPSKTCASGPGSG